MAQSFNSKKLKACGRVKSSRQNRISQLPDDILIHILSFLTMKEAGRTSLLSKRWRHVWAYLPTLNFDSSKILNDMSYGLASFKKEERKYCSWVDRVVRSHKAPTIDELRIRFGLKETRKDKIDNWIRFAMGKGVKRLELDTTPFCSNFRSFSFTFPSSCLFNSLTSLELAYVDVTGEALKKLLYDCRALESISILSSNSLVDLEVTGPFLNLKSLRIFYCFQMKNLDICAPNLLSFEYCGPILSLPFKSTPKLTEVSISGEYAIHLLGGNFLDLSSCSSQIEVLRLDASTKVIPEVFPLFPRLKVLELVILLHLHEEVFHLLYLIKTCPFLHKLTIELSFLGCPRKRSARRKEVEPFCHNQLKFVEIRNFFGVGLDLKFSMHLIERAISLEKITIIPARMQSMYESERSTKLRIQRARIKAKGLEANLKPGTKLEIH